MNIEAEVTKKHDYKLGFGSAKQCSGSSGHSPALGCLGNCLAQPCSKAPRAASHNHEGLRIEIPIPYQPDHFTSACYWDHWSHSKEISSMQPAVSRNAQSYRMLESWLLTSFYGKTLTNLLDPQNICIPLLQMEVVKFAIPSAQVFVPVFVLVGALGSECRQHHKHWRKH